MDRVIFPFSAHFSSSDELSKRSGAGFARAVCGFVFLAVVSLAAGLLIATPVMAVECDNVGAGGNNADDKGDSTNTACGLDSGTGGSAGNQFNTSTGFETGQNVNGSGNTTTGAASGTTVNGNANTATGFLAGTNVTGDNNIASGFRAGIDVFGLDNIAIGELSGRNIGSGTSFVNGTIAIGSDRNNDGFGARASANDAIAIGSDATAGHTNSVAIGNGSATTQDNQVVLGATSANSYRLAGFSNVAAGVNLNSIVTADPVTGELTSDGGQIQQQITTNTTAINNNTGAINTNATNIGANTTAIAAETARATAAEQANANAINNNTNAVATVGAKANANMTAIADESARAQAAEAALNQGINTNQAAIQQNADEIDALAGRLTDVDKRVETNTDGVAISLALAGTPMLIPSETFAFSANWGTFEGSHAFAAAGALRLGQAVQVNGGVGFTSNTAGGRAGVRFGF